MNTRSARYRWLGTDRLVLWLARRSLFLWAKTSLAPEDLGELGIDTSKPVFYVLETRSFANLLVLEQTCREIGLPRPTAAFQLGELSLGRSVFALLRRARTPREAHTHPRAATALLTAAAAADEDVQLLPVAIFWGLSPDKERSWFKVMFADSWRLVGSLRRLFTIVLHGRNIWVRFSAPVSLRRFVEPQGEQGEAAEKLIRVLRVHFRQVRAATIGPDLSHRRTLVESIVASGRVRRAIAAEASEKGLTESRATAQARSYADEIAADVSYPFMVLSMRVLRWLWSRLYDSVEVRHVETLREAAATAGVVYVPCHRSHIDYLLLTYVLYEHGFALPHIAAGINLNLPLIGRQLRRGGAFFLRRSFKGNRLYATVFNEYLATLLGRGVPIEYFVEGGRSRTGRSLAARVGMLDMTMRGFFRNPRQSVVFVPVYIGYERLVEGRSYVAELSGAPKEKESIFGLLRSVRVLKKRFGRVYLNFGEPLFLDRLLDENRPGWREQVQDTDQRPDWLLPVVTELGQRVINRINAAAVVGPINLLALILLGTPRHAMGEADLAEQIDLYLALLAGAPYSRQTVVEHFNGRQAIAYGEKLGVLNRRAHPLGDIMSFDTDNAVQMTYFRNNVLHLFALPAIIACCFLNTRQLSTRKVLKLAGLVYPFIRAELFLDWSDEEFIAVVRQLIHVMVRHKLLGRDRFGNRLSPPPADSIRGLRLKVLAQGVVHTFERFYITVALLLREGPHRTSQEELEELCQLMAQRLSLLHGFDAPEFFDRALFRNFIETLCAMGMVQTDENGLLGFDEAFSVGYEDARLMLGEEVRHSILLLTRESSARGR